jgi:FkbM family methyltransferase
MNMPPPSALEMVRRILASPGAPRTTGDAIDVGAHTGAFADELLRSGLFSRVIAFEPNPVNADALSAQASRDARLEVVRAAAGEHPGEAEMHCDSDSATGSLLEYSDQYATRGPVRRLAVAVVSLDGYRERAAPGAAPIRLLKIDTQGHDLAVLRGARGLLAGDRPLVIAELIYVPMYTGQAEPDEILAAMRAHCYDLHALFNIHVTSEGRLAFADALFVPREYQVPASQQYLQIDNHASYLTQIATLERICRERLEVINVLDAEVRRLSTMKVAGS